ncbi:hypothetical protein RFM26_32330 [Mesorhizobium sp. VK23B]|uniref:Uncharacterized protein n=1 Tax=Mesorhizobium dulcispinae TaxID=3072316 RepID=A0ABU4XPS5_9HYPH|nr:MULTISPECIES: hypothetical protein [unclassified Mesorhizobium]MDX8470354.1 hypothetical protein [Mesorhizobium sp. VK23B]MDX8476744.1 hypothetical protein [Mesorhizobium sp. VK23A]
MADGITVGRAGLQELRRVLEPERAGRDRGGVMVRPAIGIRAIVGMSLPRIAAIAVIRIIAIAVVAMVMIAGLAAWAGRPGRASCTS